MDVELLTAIRVAQIGLYLALGWRLVFYSWRITDQPVAVRVHGWHWFRAALALTVISVVALFGPENVLRANGYISAELGYWLLTAGSVLNAMAATCFLTGLDVATGHNARSFPFYCGMIATAALMVVIL